MSPCAYAFVVEEKSLKGEKNWTVVDFANRDWRSVLINCFDFCEKTNGFYVCYVIHTILRKAVVYQ